MQTIVKIRQNHLLLKTFDFIFLSKKTRNFVKDNDIISVTIKTIITYSL